MYGPTQSLAQWSMSFLHAMQYAVGQWPVLGFWPSCLGKVKPELHGQCWPVLGSWPKFLVLEGWEEMKEL